MTLTCSEGNLAGLADVQCAAKCRTPLVANSNTPENTLVDHLKTVTFACDASSTAVGTPTYTRTCKDGKLDPPIDNSNPIECKRKCTAQSGTNTKPLTSTTMNHGEIKAYECTDTTYSVKSTSALKVKCVDSVLRLWGDDDKAVATSNNPPECVKNDPNIDLFFAINHDTLVDNCDNIQSTTGNAPPYTHTQLNAANKRNYLMQYIFIQQLELEWVKPGATWSRFGIFENSAATCPVLRTLAETESAAKSALMLSVTQPYKCSSKNLEKHVTCAYDNMKTVARANVKQYLVYFSTDDKKDKDHYNGFASLMRGKPEKADMLKIFIFVIDVRNKGVDAAKIAASKAFYDTILDSTRADITKPFQGAFLGSTLDGAAAIATEMRKYTVTK